MRNSFNQSHQGKLQSGFTRYNENNLLFQIAECPGNAFNHFKASSQFYL